MRRINLDTDALLPVITRAGMEDGIATVPIILAGDIHRPAIGRGTVRGPRQPTITALMCVGA